MLYVVCLCLGCGAVMTMLTGLLPFIVRPVFVVTFIHRVITNIVAFSQLHVYPRSQDASDSVVYAVIRSFHRHKHQILDQTEPPSTDLMAVPSRT